MKKGTASWPISTSGVVSREGSVKPVSRMTSPMSLGSLSTGLRPVICGYSSSTSSAQY